jgi:ABC-type Mn2+/Zn2+ transport system ATPase subunit
MEYMTSNKDDTYFGLALTTHRDLDLGEDAVAFFQYECLLAAIAVFFCRWTLAAPKEPPLLRAVFALLLAFLAFCKKSYTLTTAVHIFSYVVPLVMTSSRICPKYKYTKLAWIALGAALSFLLSHVLLSKQVWMYIIQITPAALNRGLNYMFPITEIAKAYNVLLHFVKPAILHKQVATLFFATFHIQVGMGYLGIDFLKKEQARRNQLVRMDMMDDAAIDDNTSTTNGQETKDRVKRKQEASRRFQKGAAPFILFTAVPYMVQIILLGNINRFAFLCMQNDLSRAVRLVNLFENDEYLIAMSNDSATSPGQYAASMDTVVDTVYELFNRKLFSVPKLMLLPGIMMKQPLLVAQISPFIFASDYIKGRLISYMTSTGERLSMEAKEIRAVRSKVESFDMKNAELLQRSGMGATQFTRRKWQELSVKIQQKQLVSDLLKRTKGFFSFIQRNFIFGVLIDCALANLIAMGKIVSSEIFVFSRAIEDAVDLVLMKSRAESELAQMLTEVDKLQQLADVWETTRERTPLPCAVAPPEVARPGIVVRNLHYSRGSAIVRIDHVELPPGMYALTGVNGSGKSTFFRVLMSCGSNDKTIGLPDSIFLQTPSDHFKEEPKDACIAADEESCEVVHNDVNDSDEIVPKAFITMPSSDVVEISQSFYWPLYTRPIDWIYQCHLLEENDEAEAMVRRVAEELQALEFRQASSFAQNDDGSDGNATETVDPLEASVISVMEELTDVKEDWFNDLSGGQKSKVELVRKVFLHDRCPSVLLIDETMAPLDPNSKSIVMEKLKRFCADSVVIVIYHTDVRENEDGESIDCVPSNDFFDENIHLVNHTLVHRPVC